MLNHPGVICYHADYPKPELSEWVEIYANDDTFASHLDDPAASEPLGELINCCSKVSCRCWGDPNPASKERLKAFAAEYQNTGKGSFVLKTPIPTPALRGWISASADPSSNPCSNASGIWGSAAPSMFASRCTAATACDSAAS